MQIENCNTTDVDAILHLYEDARRLQTERKMVVWPPFETAFIEAEIVKGQQWKIVMNGKIACNWTITLVDKEIWEDKELGDAIYIHRIATDPGFRGNNFVGQIVDWAKTYARSLNRKYVRLDTLGNNTRLIEHYTSAGFTFLGMVQLSNTSTLPEHYQKEPGCCLFEIAVN